MDSLHMAIDLLADRRRILLFTGAGISTESGIPDFRGPDGVWTRVDPREFTIDRYMANPETRRRSWAMRAGSGVLDARPNPAHRAIVDLWESERMLGCVTQNIDGLHQAAGLPDEAVVELHGNARQTVCVGCQDRQPTPAVMDRVAAGEGDRPCRRCGGILKPDVVFFGEWLPERALDRSFALAADSDAVISVGSTLSVYPAAQVPVEAVRAGAPLIILNRGETDLDSLAQVRIDGAAGEALPAMITALLA